MAKLQWKEKKDKELMFASREEFEKALTKGGMVTTEYIQSGNTAIFRPGLTKAQVVLLEMDKSANSANPKPERKIEEG
ncbi:hypothetical protein MMC14_009034 [Varicellaria rhodocarpa]|nr:hypothetical protein [Varicellaria rhodocarpa]